MVSAYAHKTAKFNDLWIRNDHFIKKNDVKSQIAPDHFLNALSPFAMQGAIARQKCLNRSVVYNHLDYQHRGPTPRRMS